MQTQGTQCYASLPLQCSQHERPKIKHYLGGKHHQQHCSVFLSIGTAPKWYSLHPHPVSFHS